VPGEGGVGGRSVGGTESELRGNVCGPEAWVHRQGVFPESAGHELGVEVARDSLNVAPHQQEHEKKKVQKMTILMIKKN